MEIKKLQWRGATVGCFLNTASIFTVIVLEKDFINIIEHAIISIARLKKKQWWKDESELWRSGLLYDPVELLFVRYVLYPFKYLTQNKWIDERDPWLFIIQQKKKKKGKLFLAVKSCL